MLITNRDNRIRMTLTVLAMLSLIDLACTIWAHIAFHFHELNPFARFLLNSHQLTPLILAKLAMTSFGVAIFWHLREHLRAEIGLWICLFMYIALTIRWGMFTLEVLR